MIYLLKCSEKLYTKAMGAFVALILFLAVSDVALALPGLPPIFKRPVPHPHPAPELSLSAIAGALVLAGCLILLIHRARRNAN